MALLYFTPEIWAAGLLGTLSQSAVYAGAPCSNRDYEGEISAFGDTVHIDSISDPTITAYVKNVNLADPEALTDAEQQLVIDQAYSFNFQVDDIDKAQVRNNGALMTEATQRAGWGLRDGADKFVANKMALAASNHLGVIDASTAANVYDKLIVPAGVALDQANVPEELRWIVLDPAAYGALRLDARFINLNQSGTAALHNGQVGEAGGFRIYKSNNAPQVNRAITTSIAVATGAKTLTSATQVFTQGDVGAKVDGTNITTGTTIASVNAAGTVATMSAVGTAAAAQTDTVVSGGGQLAIAGSSIAHSYAEQILEIEGYRPEKRFGDALKGLHVYGSKVVRPTALVVASVKVA